MVKKYECPVCEQKTLQIDIKNGYKVVFSGKIGKLPCRIYCKNCKRFIKYEVVKEEN